MRLEPAFPVIWRHLSKVGQKEGHRAKPYALLFVLPHIAIAIPSPLVYGFLVAVPNEDSNISPNQDTVSQQIVREDAGGKEVELLTHLRHGTELIRSPALSFTLQKAIYAASLLNQAIACNGRQLLKG